MATNWIIDTGQAWKLYMALAGFGGAVLCFTVAFFRLAIGSGQFLGLTACGLFLGVATFLWFMATVRCPHCHAKLVWNMVASRPHSSWLIDLAALDDCPLCHHALAGKGRQSWPSKGRANRRLHCLGALAVLTLTVAAHCPLSGWWIEARAGGGESGQPDGARQRARDLGIVIGHYPPGPYNAITDVAGVKVGHVTLIRGAGKLQPGEGPVRTGVTVVIPRDDVWRKKVPAGAFVLNGTGEMTGLAWVAESGVLEYPIALTSTLNLPRVANGVMSWMIKRYPGIGITDDTLTPVVAECDDSRLNDSQGRHVSEADVIAALEGATSGPVPEGTVGAGTGMVSYGFKGGIGTASRRLPEEEGGYTVGVLVNANQGRRPELVVAGVPVGRRYEQDRTQHEPALTGEGSIIIVIATDAPLDSRQLTRLAKRAVLGLGRTGTAGRHGSGDFMLAFSTGNVIPHYPEARTFSMTHLADTHLNPLLTATVEATEEAILNALTTATSVTGRDGRRIEAISLSRLRTLLGLER